MTDHKHNTNFLLITLLAKMMIDVDQLLFYRVSSLTCYSVSYAARPALHQILLLHKKRKITFYTVPSVRARVYIQQKYKRTLLPRTVTSFRSGTSFFITYLALSQLGAIKQSPADYNLLV